MYTDQGTILDELVYGAFSGAVVAGLLNQVSGMTLFILTVVCSVFLTIVMLLAWYIPCWLGFSVPDQKAVFFCGSKKTLLEWRTDGADSICRATSWHDCFADYDFSPNSADGLQDRMVVRRICVS